MEKADSAKTQEEFAKDMSELSARFAAAWVDVVKRAGLPAVPDPSPKTATEWPDPSLLFKLVRSPSAMDKLQGAMKLATADLPELLACAGDPEKTGRITDRWTRLCDESVRHMLGIPGPSETQRLLEQWGEIANVTGSGKGLFPGTTIPAFLGMVPSAPGPFAFFQHDQVELLRTLTETYGKMFDKVFIPPGQAADLEARTKSAMDAQIRFLKSFPEFQERILTASRKMMERLIKNIEKLGKEEITPEVLQLFSQMWSSGNQSLFQELFMSDSFLRPLAKTVQEGADASKRMEDLMSDWLSLWARPHPKDLDDLNEKVYSMEKRIRLLERELEDMQRQWHAAFPNLRKVDEA
jgi:hypothetical protein